MLFLFISGTGINLEIQQMALHMYYCIFAYCNYSRDNACLDAYLTRSNIYITLQNLDPIKETTKAATPPVHVRQDQ